MIPKNKKGRPFSWSYTALTSFENCPKRYAAEKFYCTVPFIESEAVKWGNRVHAAAEYSLKGIPVTDHEAYAPVRPYVEAIQKSGLRIEAESEVTLTRDMKKTGWFAKDAWFRVKLDIILSDETTAKIFDWKTGALREDQDQLRVCIAALATVRSQVKHFEGRLIFTKHKHVSTPVKVPAAEVPTIWQDFLPRVARMEEAWRVENFPAKPSGLCPWCAVTGCSQRRGSRKV